MTNLKILIYDHDLFALHAMNSYLAWDRRTRVHFLTNNIEEAFEWLVDNDESEWPDIILLDTYSLPNPSNIKQLIKRFLSISRSFKIVVMAHEIDYEMALATLEAGGVGFLVRNDVNIYLASTIVWIYDEKFGVSASLLKTLPPQADPRIVNADIMPERRDYPELTERIRQAIQLCVVEGMSADLAADEMGVSTHTIRSYIKEGYRILEAYDENGEYPTELSAQERAFIRFTSLEAEEEVQFPTEKKD